MMTDMVVVQMPNVSCFCQVRPWDARYSAGLRSSAGSDVCACQSHPPAGIPPLHAVRRYCNFVHRPLAAAARI